MTKGVGFESCHLESWKNLFNTGPYLLFFLNGMILLMTSTVTDGWNSKKGLLGVLGYQKAEELKVILFL